MKKMTRRTFLMGMGGAALLASFASTRPANGKAPNVIWIVTDDQPQYMKDPLVYTSKYIRNKGAEFVNGHADIPLCGPARATLLTGQSVTTHGVDTNGGTYQQFKQAGLDEVTIARYLKDAGYRTGHFGKYVNAHFAYHGTPPYWDAWHETRTQEGSAPSINSARHLSEWIKARANEPTPFFAQYAPTIPHQPYTPTARGRRRFGGTRRAVPSVNESRMGDKPYWMRQLPKEDADALQKEYEGKMQELSDLDYFCIRPVLNALFETGQFANTYIFFTSDNGYMHGEHRLWKKDEPYWESAEVPFYVVGPGVKASKRSALVSHVDLAPTTAAIAGVTIPDTDGRNILSDPPRKRLLVSGSDSVGPNAPKGENPGGAWHPSGSWWLLREGRAAFILREKHQKELYYLKSDPYQQRSKHRKVPQATLDRFTSRVWQLRNAKGDARRGLENA